MKKRNLTVLASSALLAACLVSAPAMLNANADGSFFQMVDGATIRTTPENPGIRFSATMSSDVYSSVVAENSGKSFGMLVVPTDYLAGATDTDGDGVKNYVEYVSANYKKEVGGERVVLGLMEDLTAYSYDVNKDGTNDICISGAVTGMQFNNMNRDFTGIAFIKTVGTEKTTYKYATTLTGEYASRNITYVASAASLDPDNAAFESTLTGFVQAGVKLAAGLAETDAMPEVSATLLNGKTTTSDIEDVKLEAALSVNDQALAIELAYAWASNNETALAIDKTKGYAIPQDVSEAAEAKVTYTVGGLEAYTTDVTVNVFSQYEDVKQYYNMEEENATDGAGVTDFAAQANAKVSVLEGKTLTYGVWSSGEHMTDIEADMNADGKLSTADMIEFRNYALTAYVMTETGRKVGAYACVAQPFKLSTVISTGAFTINDTYLNNVAYLSNGGAFFNNRTYSVSTSFTYTNGNNQEQTVTDTLMHFVSGYASGGVHLYFPSDYEVGILEYVRNAGYTLKMNKWQNDNTSGSGNVTCYYRTGTTYGDLSTSSTSRASINLQYKWYNTVALDWDGYLTSLKADSAGVTDKKQKALLYFKTTGTGSYYFSNIYFVKA